ELGRLLADLGGPFDSRRQPGTVRVVVPPLPPIPAAGGVERDPSGAFSSAARRSVRPLISRHGALYAEFAEPGQARRAYVELRAQGYARLETHSPFPLT